MRNDTLKSLRKPVRTLIRGGIWLGALGGVSALVPLFGLAALADALQTAPPDLHRIAILAALIVICAVSGWLATTLAMGLTHLADERLQARLRGRIITHLGVLPLGWFTGTHSGIVRKAVEDDLTELHYLTAHHEVERVRAVSQPLIGLFCLSLLNWRLALLAVATWPLYGVAYLWMMRGYRENLQHMDRDLAAISAAIVELIRNIVVIKSYRQARRIHNDYGQATSRFAAFYGGWAGRTARIEAISALLLSVPVIMLTSLAGGYHLVTAGQVTPVMLLAEIMVAITLPQSFQTLHTGNAAFKKAQAAAERLEHLLSLPILPAPTHPLSPRSAEVTFDHVSFAYDDGRPVLGHISFTCAPGTVTALIGPSGAGKSTLARLVPRFYDVTEGAIRLGGVDVRQLDRATLYKQVGFVLQEVELLHGTVRDNIRLGKVDAGESDIIAAAQAAQIDSVIQALPQGYDTIIGDKHRFSGGEAQRIALARMILANRPILILDEATSSADPDHEVQIQAALSHLARGRTVIVIAHRLASIVHADQILVLAEGQIIQKGRHEALIAQDGCYKDLWEVENRAQPHAHPAETEGALPC
ncbi:ABC transporter ATP-binding protein/permease [Candidatus Kirkpatrickella diaphorinae]|uniref:ABC transporter ATP-binding protein/permease n=1 Tax=Candidatus Kirkpatrickella diaphorinae TaxID=2984322 RepID=A0ABY6GJA3_9PROT|nr:ABC transporter ATP-binding protein [Candidatus Kirkpatrickella diaphorinae]UYH51617.1 ABC transporter ATP-binding protein/permease [Candidatus Kirkpatrickella diaphorinae]